MAIARAMDAKLYYNSTSMADALTVVALNVQDVMSNLDANEADASTRDHKFELGVATLLKMTVDVTILDVPGDAFLAAVEACFLGTGTLAIWAKDKVSGKGPKFDAMVAKFTRNEKLKNVIAFDVTLKPTLTANDPTYA